MQILALVAAVESNQSAMAPAGDQASQILSLWRLFVWVSVIVWALVMIFLIIGAVRRRAGAHGPAVVGPALEPVAAHDLPREQRTARVVGGLVGLTTIILIVLMLGDFRTGRSMASLGKSSDFIAIAVTGRQWWWEVQYQDATPSNYVITANEIHIPVGRAVRIELRSGDVIHSLWVPNLQGKKDLVPGHPAQLWLRADEPGIYNGQCAEFCGLQHANMRLVVIAEAPEKFEQWLANQRKPAAEPTTEMQRRGKEVFLSRTCVMCHSIGGTPAFGRAGPNLTHVASRQTLAAGAVANRPGHLAGWILDPQKIKPGTRMPQHALPPGELRALLEYLESLK